MKDWVQYKDIADEWKTFWHGFGQGTSYQAILDKNGNSFSKKYAEPFMKRWYKEKPEGFVEAMENTRRKHGEKARRINGIKKTDEGETIQ